MVDVTTNNWAMSADVSVFLLDQMAGEGNLVFFRMAEHHGTRKRGDVMEVVLREYYGVSVLAEHNIDYTAFFEDTAQTMEDYIARFGDDIDAVWAPWDEPAQAVINALNAAGLFDVKVIGIDGHPQASIPKHGLHGSSSAHLITKLIASTNSCHGIGSPKKPETAPQPDGYF